MIELSREQQDALLAIQNWHRSGGKEPFRIFGPAGTGKSTLAGMLPRALGGAHVVYGTFTGKAAHVLKRKGVPATTIHSAIYRPVGNDAELKTELETVTKKLGLLEPMPDLPGVVARRLVLQSEKKRIELALSAGVQFRLDPESEWRYADLIVLDEVSMVDSDIRKDTESFGVPVLVLGDPAQLPPIAGAGAYAYGEPDVLLREVHRQALDSPILNMATRVRLGRGFRPGERVKTSIAEAMKADQVICWKNVTRWNLLKAMRFQMGYPHGEVVPGDRIICLSNNSDIGVLNGMQFRVEAVDHSKAYPTLTLLDDDGMRRVLPVYPEGFHGLDGEKALSRRRPWSGPTMAATYAQVITCHKAQGSEWDWVYVVDQTAGMQDEKTKRRWMYTAITRARERVTVAINQSEG